MKNILLALFGSAAVMAAWPAMAGPDWAVIERGRAAPARRTPVQTPIRVPPRRHRQARPARTITADGGGGRPAPPLLPPNSAILCGASTPTHKDSRMTNATDLRAYAYVLAVPDLARSAGYFESVLGFSTDWKDGDNWRALSRGSVRVMLGHCPDALPPSQTGDHSYFAYFHVDDIDALHAELASRGASSCSRPPISRGACARWHWPRPTATG